MSHWDEYVKNYGRRHAVVFPPPKTGYFGSLGEALRKGDEFSQAHRRGPLRAFFWRLRIRTCAYTKLIFSPKPYDLAWWRDHWNWAAYARYRRCDTRACPPFPKVHPTVEEEIR